MKKEKIRIIIYCLVLSVVFLLLCTKNSPLYKINDWQDVNAFFTMGKSMVNGLVPYKDLFEQKGPLLYLIYGIASLISETSFIGAYILEVFFFTVTLYYISKIIAIFIDKKFIYPLLPLFSAIILTSRAFTHGGSCEEFCLPFIIIALYYFIKYIKTSTITNKEIIIVGITAASVLWMKYTLLGFHIGFVIVVLIKTYTEKSYKDLLRKILYFLLGFSIITIPFLIYFWINNAFDKLINVYFIFNMTCYGQKITIIEKIMHCITLISQKLLIQYDFLFLILLPLILSIKNKILFKTQKENFFLLGAFIIMLFGIYIGGTNYRYYALPIYIFIIFGLIFIVKTSKLISNNSTLKDIVRITLIINMWCLAIIWYKSGNIIYMKYEKKDYAQFVFSDLIEKNKTILNYGFLDGGFYFSTNTIPEFYYFEKQNVSYNNYKDNMDEQNRYIKEKIPDYVITKNKRLPNLQKDYYCIKTHTQYYENHKIEYSLYKRK